MTGKIFSDSGNVYQDQAKILFNYYQQVAEKIVKEEERIEKQIKSLEEEKALLQAEIGTFAFWVFTILTLSIYYFWKTKDIAKQVAAIDERIAEFQKQHKEIFRDYKVSKLGVAYVPVADQIKYEDKSFIVDYTGKVDESEVTLQMSRRNDLLVETIGKLEQLSAEAPIVENSDDIEKVETEEYSRSIQEINHYDYLGNLERSLRTIAYCMDDLEVSSVSLPLVQENSQYLHSLNEYATRDIPETAPIVEVFDKERYESSVEKFQELNKLKDSLSNKTQQFETVLKDLMVTMANSVQTISALKVASVDKVIFEANKVLFNILKSPYNHYSPTLEFEEIERIREESFDYSEDVQNYEPFNLKQSSRMKFNLVTGMWTSEDGNTSNVPFGVHQIYEEIVAPVVQNLMQETRIERLKIYNHIKDQKISYLNKWHQDTEAFYRANRAESSDIINLMQESLREYVAAYNTLASLKKTENAMNQSKSINSTVVETQDNSEETILAYEYQSQEFMKVQEEFEEYMERLKEDIDLKAQKFGHVEYYDAKLRDGYSNEVAVAADEVHALDERRKALATVNPHFAKTSEIPPQPSVEDITFEHISLNLPVIAKNALDKIEEITVPEVAVAESAAEQEVEQLVTMAGPVEAAVDEADEETVEEAVTEQAVTEQAVAEQAVAEQAEEPEEVEVEDFDEDDDEDFDEDFDEDEDDDFDEDDDDNM
ncbi:MAG: hypothetical protein IKY48_01830 [Bacteroidales bacterium]|nr:hypothetical protein [Bacteroidales bacterium]